MFGLFKKPAPPTNRQAPMDLFISTLGEVMEAHNGPIEDVTVLPADKKLFKEAILAKLSTLSDNKQRSILAKAYLMLSTFQPLTEAEKQVLQAYNTLMSGTPPVSVNNERDRLIIAQFMTVAPAYNAILERTVSERELLVTELRTAGVQNA